MNKILPLGGCSKLGNGGANVGPPKMNPGTDTVVPCPGPAEGVCPDTSPGTAVGVAPEFSPERAVGV